MKVCEFTEACSDDDFFINPAGCIACDFSAGGEVIASSGEFSSRVYNP